MKTKNWKKLTTAIILTFIIGTLINLPTLATNIELNIWTTTYTPPNYTNIELILRNDTCTPPIINNTWNILFSDNCTTDRTINLGNGTLNIYGNQGIFTIAHNLTTHKTTLTCYTTNCKLAVLTIGKLINQ